MMHWSRKGYENSKSAGDDQQHRDHQGQRHGSHPRMRYHQDAGHCVQRAAHEINEEAAPGASRKSVNDFEQAAEDQQPSEQNHGNHRHEFGAAYRYGAYDDQHRSQAEKPATMRPYFFDSQLRYKVKPS